VCVHVRVRVSVWGLYVFESVYVQERECVRACVRERARERECVCASG